MYRKLPETAHEFTDLAYSGDKEAPPTPEDFDDVSDWLAEQNDLVEPANDNGGLPPTAEQILRSMYARPLPERAQTGIPELDAITGGGLIPGNLVFICAPPGSGKTGFVIFQGVTFEAAGRPVVLAEMELSQEETAARVASQHTRVAVRAVVEDRTPEAQAATLAAVSGKNIFVLADRPKIRDIERAIVAVRTKFGKSPVLIVDFLQQMPSDDQRQDARTAVGTTAYALKAMAEKHGCCCLVVSSVARDRYGSLETDDPRAWLAFAKESGDVEFSAGVLSVLEVGEFDPATGESAGRLVIAKNRHGQTGFVGLRFHGASGAWRADPTAVAEFGEDARKAKNGAREHGKAVRKDVDDDRQLWGQLKKIGTVTRSKFKNAASKGGNRDEVKAQWGMSPEAALEAFDRLVASGRISVTDEVVQTPGGSQKAKVARAVDLEWPIGTEAAS
ncbi:MAG: DnaB-like helicase C-terminal domain-containing protein [Myxococcales bacterium]